MAELSMFMIFESWQLEEKKCTLTNPLAVIQPAVIPGNFSFIISFSLLGIPQQEDHVLSAAFISPSGKRYELLQDRKVTIPPTSTHQNVPFYGKNSCSLTMDIRNFLFDEEGNFIFSFVIDEQEYVHSFPVYKRDVREA